jgi:SAM-dependent MidA family methyltransferase
MFSIFKRKEEAEVLPIEAGLRQAVAAAPGEVLPFSDFMRVALFDPEHGYYARHGADVGRYGAFYREPLTSAIFAQSLAAQFEQMWQLLGRPATFTIVEQGANNAAFSIALLSWLAQWRPEIYQGLRYVIVEPIPALRREQEARVREAGLAEHFYWAETLAQLAGQGGAGIFYNCEFADSLPARLVLFQDGWQELLVAWPAADAAPHFTPKPVENAALLEEIARWEIPKLRRYRAEICLQLPQWQQEAAAVFERAFFLTIAYGFDAETLYHRNRTAGSIHTLKEGSPEKGADLLADAGSRDISYMVNFSALQYHGEAAGLETLGVSRQSDAMTALARPAYDAFYQANEKRQGEQEVVDILRAFRTLLNPPLTAGSYRFLVQGKGLDAGPRPLEKYPIAALVVKE